MTMFVEVDYEGAPGDFAWLLPLPEPPKDELGLPARLEQILFVSTRALFDRLEDRTTADFRVSNTFEGEPCQDPPGGGGADASGSADNGSGGEGDPVEVLQETEIGLLGVQLLRADKADDLFAWLDESGFSGDESARPALADYVERGYVFLVFKLRSERSRGDLRPIEIQLGDAPLSVPLRLSAVASEADMPLRVWVLGDYRAVPKNTLHVKLNPKALVWPEAPNYEEVVSAAVDAVGGRAFVTELATTEPLMDAVFDNLSQQTDKEFVQTAKTLAELWGIIQVILGRDDIEILTLLREHVPMPDGLRGYPYGNCFYDPFGEGDPAFEDACEPNEEHVTTEEEFYGYLGYWDDHLAKAGTPLEVDVPALAEALVDTWFVPRERIQAIFDRATWITRLFTTISAGEMTRDPLFAFNRDLGPVAKDHEIATLSHSTADCSEAWVDATYEDGSSHRFPCASGCLGLPSVGPVEGESALLEVAVTDEDGQARPFDPEAASEVDALLDVAEIGKPSLPAWYELPPPPGGSTPVDPGPSDAGSAGSETGASSSDASGSPGTDALVDPGSGSPGTPGVDAGAGPGGPTMTGDGGGGCGAGPAPAAPLLLALALVLALPRGRLRWS